MIDYQGMCDLIIAELEPAPKPKASAGSTLEQLREHDRAFDRYMAVFAARKCQQQRTDKAKALCYKWALRWYEQAMGRGE